MTRSGKKSMLSRYSFLEVNKMYQPAEWTRGSKNEQEEASRGCSSLHIVANPCNGPWLFPAEDEVRAGVSCRHTWEPELVSPFHHDRSWTFFGVLCLLLGGACFVVCLLFCCPRLVFPFVYYGTMTATIVMMSAAHVQKKTEYYVVVERYWVLRGFF